MVNSQGLETIISLVGVLTVMMALLYMLFKKSTQKFMLSDKAMQLQQKSAKKKEDLGEKITWDMIGGYEDVKKEIKEYIELPLRHKELAKKYGLRPPKGILLFGPPGCGKSLMMRAMANEAKINFIYVNISDIMSKWYGESEARLRELFANARKNAPCILFFDEIDTIGVKRESHTGDSVTPRLLSLMLSEIDGIHSEDGVIIVGSTNVPQLLDKALLRAGRFDKLIYVGVPDKKSRKEILKIHCAGKPLAENVDLDKVAEMTERFTGADLANVCQEVARKAAIESLESGKERQITMEDFAEVIKRYKPSVTLQMLDDYEKFRMDYERKFKGPEIQEDESAEKITLDDIGGYFTVKKELYDLLEVQLKYSNLMEQMKIPPIRGILLYGPPGVGKTMMAKALARTLKVKLIMLSGAEILYKGYEGAVSTVKEVFNRARENKPSIVLLDELVAIAPKREGQKAELAKIVNQLLTEMDGIRSLKEVVVIGTTNRIEDIDPALKRPGRFDRIIYMPLPNKDEREDILKKYVGKDECQQVNCGKIAEVTEGFSGADLAAVAREAKLKVLREIIKGNVERKLTYEDLIEAVQMIKPSVKQRKDKNSDSAQETE
ncbi:ATPase AAA [Stygiolobus caldivivus]|uniref:ATPase AAA n=2 Tax=Stygiolobus caldivivus TaxID=2824673 RepID=A0A8D5U590_9CREN|nr:AAA family ATPase [Stygiolobus caldivivus]BCU69529.1 ATPase AAA [Stygiolobus caldivivus]